MQSTCSVESCTRKHSCKGFCASHYSRFKKTGSAYKPCSKCGCDLPLGKRGKSKVCHSCCESAVCSVDSCDRPIKTRGMCGPHYARWLNVGTPYRPCSRCGVGLSFDTPASTKFCGDCQSCSVDGCTEKAAGRGLCRSHYSRLRKTGSLSRKCRGCGSEIPVTVAHGVRYCSKECRPTCTIGNCDKKVKASGLCDAHYKRIESSGSPSRNCGTCGTEFHAGMDSGRKYCSDECAPRCTVEECNDRAVNKVYCSRHAIQKKKYGHVPPLDYVCAGCGKKVTRSHAERRAKRSRKTCAECSAKLHRGYEWYRKKVFESGSAICGLCDEEIDLELKWPDPMSLTIDHIIPLALGGTNEDINLQPTHQKCNFKKGARLTIPKEGEKALF